MDFFRKRATPVENMTLIAIAAGIDGLLALVSALLPLGALFLLFAIPLFSALVAIYCKKAYYPLYVLVALGVSLAASAWDLANTIFYLFPSLLTGGLYGILIDKKVPSSFLIFFTSCLQFVLFIATFFLIKAIYGVDMGALLLRLVNKPNEEPARIILPLFGYAYALSQVALVHFFAVASLSRLGIQVAPERNRLPMYSFLSIAFLISAFILAFFFPAACYVLLGMGVYWAILSFYRLFLSPRAAVWIAFGFLCFLALLCFAAFYGKMPRYSGLSLCLLLFLAPPFSEILHFLLLRKGASDPRIK